MPVQSAIAWYMAYLLGMREKQKPPLLEERGEGVCKGLLLQPLRLSRGIRWVLALAFDVLNAIFTDQSEEFALAKPLFDCSFLPL